MNDSPSDSSKPEAAAALEMNNIHQHQGSGDAGPAAAGCEAAISADVTPGTSADGAGQPPEVGPAAPPEAGPAAPPESGPAAPPEVSPAAPPAGSPGPAQSAEQPADGEAGAAADQEMAPGAVPAEQTAAEPAPSAAAAAAAASGTGEPSGQGGQPDPAPDRDRSSPQSPEEKDEEAGDVDMEETGDDEMANLSRSTNDDSDHSDLSDDSGDRRHSALAASLEDVKKKVNDILAKPKPKHTWALVKELARRQRGERPSLLYQDRFRLNMYDSLHAAERLELMAKLQYHEGCVNCLHFNASGHLLASGSDDLHVAVWDWQRQATAFTYNSGHKSNIFEARFLPLLGDTHIVSTSRDGQVRMAEISPSGECRSVKRLAQHRGSGRKLALPADSAHTVLSCGEDAVVFNIDVRQKRPDILAICTENGKRVATNSIAAHPEQGHSFLLSCVDKYVRLYDRRMMGAEQQPYARLCPHKLLDSDFRYSVTCAVFNYNGTEIVASYNDEDIYLFDASHSDGADAVHQYSGHRNSATVKGVNFFGPTSQFVVSGSDCGNIFIWHKATEAIVQCMPGDESGVVNCLEPHPHVPVLATSGLDDDVKIWIPSRDDPPDLSKLRETVDRNLRDRVEEALPSAASLGGSLMWSLMQQVLGSQRRRHQLFAMDSDDEGGSSDSEDERPGECRPS